MSEAIKSPTSPLALILLWQLTTKENTHEECIRVSESWMELERNLLLLKPFLQGNNVWSAINDLRETYSTNKKPMSEIVFVSYLKEEFDQLYSEYVMMDDEDTKPLSVEDIAQFIVIQKQRKLIKEGIEKSKDVLAEEGPAKAQTFLQDFAMSIPLDGEIIEANLNNDNVLQGVKEHLDDTIARFESGTLNIKTGLRQIDDLNVFPQHGQMVGILGAAGGFKSTFARTYAYNACMQNFSIVYFPLETTINVELDLFTVQHVLRNKPWSGLNRTMCNNGTIGRDTKEYKDYQWGIQDLKRLAAEREIKLPTFLDFPTRTSWAGIRKEIYKRCKAGKIDMVFIDYLTLISKDGAKEPRVFMEDVIIDLAKLAKSEDITVVTPMQANRSGKSNIGKSRIWDSADICNYSELEKSFDLIYSVYNGKYEEETLGEDSKGNERIIKQIIEMPSHELAVGTCKTRSVQPIREAIELFINIQGGFITNHPDYMESIGTEGLNDITVA